MAELMDNTAITEIVTQHMAAWNEPDDTARRALLEQCWSDSGVYLDPNVSLVGRDALATKIGKVLASRPGARLEFMSGIDVHHAVVRFLWRLVRADGTCGDTSIDFGEVGPDGRLTSLVHPLRCRELPGCMRISEAFAVAPLPPLMS
jgi:hypothetical protein